MLGVRPMATHPSSSPNIPVVEIHSGLTLKGQLSMVKDLLITGKFEGDLQTLGSLKVASGAAAKGTIEAGALVLEPGNEVEAMVKISSGTPPKPFDMVKKINAGKWPSRLKKVRDLVLGRR